MKMQEQKPDQDLADFCKAKYLALHHIGKRSAMLFVNFFLIIMALYQLKPASRSLFIGSLGAEQLPYVWITTAITMSVLITYYHKLVQLYSRINVVLGTCLVFSAVLVLFRIVVNSPSPIVPIALYVFVDIAGVVLVEQFWSLTNSIYTTREGKTWYGFLGTGGLVGGVIGGGFAAILINKTPLQTPDLLLTAVGILLIIFAITWFMGRAGIYCEVDHMAGVMPQKGSWRGNWRILGHSRYLLLIAGILLLAQLASPIIEYQFLNTVGSSFPEREARTEFLSLFFSGMGLASIGINLAITPLVHRFFGPIGGLLAQPLMISLFSWCFSLHSTLFFGGAAKISDRGLSYSINRASKELLYTLVDSILIYQAKAWIDMFGYRLFKVAGSFLILLFTQWLPFTVSVPQLSWFTAFICLIWIGLIVVLRQEYHVMRKQAV
jgi:AAA family ATP:ADP antiporter